MLRDAISVFQKVGTYLPCPVVLRVNYFQFLTQHPNRRFVSWKRVAREIKRQYNKRITPPYFVTTVSNSGKAHFELYAETGMIFCRTAARARVVLMKECTKE